MKKTLYIDMDGVIADFDKGIKRYDTSLETALTGPNLDERRRRVNEICEANPRIFLELPLIPGAKESINELSELFDLYFLSTPMDNVPHSFTDKRLWLSHHYGPVAVKRLILTHRKDLNIGHFLVDDNVWHGVEQFKGLHIHFGNFPFENWNKVTEYLKRNS